MLFVPVENRSWETLLRILNYWIYPDFVAVSDCWKSYACLVSEGFHHVTLNHMYNFVDPNTGAFTQYRTRARVERFTKQGTKNGN